MKITIKQVRAYTISDDSFYFLKELGEEKGKSASYVLDELIKMVKRIKQENNNG